MERRITTYEFVFFLFQIKTFIFSLKKIDGRGRLVQPHVTYDGYWRNGVKCKKGVLLWANGDKFTGHFRNDAINGEGTLLCQNGDKYIGTWKDNMVKKKNFFFDHSTTNQLKKQRHGQGTSISLFGRYDGEWMNNVREGNGSFLFLNGDRYIGEWKQNKVKKNFLF